MIQRTSNPNSKMFKHYGGRNIFVCDRWRLYDNFLADMGRSLPGTSLGRIDNNKGYSPENCRWETKEQQANNTRRNVFIEHNGIRLTVAQWAKKTGVPERTLHGRVSKGWPISVALMPGCFRGKKNPLWRTKS